MKVTIARINKEIDRVGGLENRPTVKGTVEKAYFDKKERMIFVAGNPRTNVSSFARVRKFVAKNLDVNDIYEGIPPKECEQIF